EAGHYAVPHNAVLKPRRQLSGRLVFLGLGQPEGPYVATTLSASGVADGRGVEMDNSTVALGARLQDPGAVLSGHRLTADRPPVPSALVRYVNNTDFTCQDVNRLDVAEAVTGGSGQFELRYVRQDNCGGPFALDTLDPVTGALREVSTSVRNAGEHLALDIALLGRGAVDGTVRHVGGAPAAGASVVALS